MFPTKIFEKKRILVGIGGCIAAYKACYLIRHLVTAGTEVRAMLSKAGEQFITRLTIETLTNHPVYSEMFPENQFTATHHIELADWAEAAIISPATANALGKAANGIADDFFSTVLSALHCPTVYAPAMNTHMWQNPAVQRNVDFLSEHGAHICHPETGFLAEGYEGVGRLARLEYQLQYLYRACHPAPNSLTGKQVLITAGPTREFLDPVRMLTNLSSGKMGYALAWEAFARGADVTLISGPTELEQPAGMNIVPVVSAADFAAAADQHFPEADIYVSAAAIADYTTKTIAAGKIKKGRGDLQLPLERTIDVLQTLGQKKRKDQQLIGFAVETDSPLKNAKEKLKRKNLDMIVLNNPKVDGAAFRSDTNFVTLISATQDEGLEKMYKLDVAREIFNFLLNSEKN